jgi:dihydroorotase-like cyclic amidohydrolase
VKRGSIEAGFSADFVIWNPEERADSTSHSKHPELNIFGAKDDLYGRIDQVWVRGRVAFDKGTFVSNHGQRLTKS